MIQLNSSIDQFKYLGENSIIYRENNKFVTLSLVDKKPKKLFKAKYSIMFDVVSDRFIISVLKQENSFKLVFWDLKTSLLSEIASKNVSSLCALKSGKILIATYGEANISISIWCENLSAGENEPAFNKIKELHKAHDNKVFHMIELADNMIATASEEVINIWNGDLSEILYKFNDNVNTLHYVFDEILMICNSKGFLFWNYKTNIVLNRFETSENIRFSFVTDDRKFLVIQFNDKMKFFDTNSFYCYASYPILQSLKDCQFSNTYISNGVFHRVYSSNFQSFDFKL